MQIAVLHLDTRRVECATLENCCSAREQTRTRNRTHRTVERRGPESVLSLLPFSARHGRDLPVPEKSKLPAPFLLGLLGAGEREATRVAKMAAEAVYAHVHVLCLRPSGKNWRMCARSLKISRNERPAALREEQTTRVSLKLRAL